MEAAYPLIRLKSVGHDYAAGDQRMEGGVSAYLF
jgi:hypothetical protein